MSAPPPADAQAILSDLARVKAHFQLRTVAMVIGAPPPRPPEPAK